MSVYITALETERFKRIKAVSLVFTAEGLNVIGGGNGEGKTSILDSIMYLLGGEKYRPSEINNDEEPADQMMKLSNGLTVERKGKNASLKVTDANGLSGNQGVLDKFVEQLALDLPKFMAGTDKNKAEILLQIIGAGDDLKILDARERDLYDRRRDAGRDLDQAKAELEGLPTYEGVPDKAVSMSEILNDIECAEKENEQRQDKKDDLDMVWVCIRDCNTDIETAKKVIESSELQLKKMQDSRLKIEKALEGGAMIDVDPIKNKLVNIERDQEKARANEKHAAAVISTAKKEEAHEELEKDVRRVRAERTKLLEGVDMPLDGLSIDDGELVYNDSRWDCMSGADQLMVATSIVKQLNPDCGFVLIDKLEQMDIETMKEFGAWAAAQGLQIIATRVSTGDECSIIIEDGQVLEGSAK